MTDSTPGSSRSSESPDERRNSTARPAPWWRGYAEAALATFAATALGWVLYHGFHLPDERRRPLLADANVLMLYLLSVLWVATRTHRGAAALASVLGVAAFDFCFVRPYLTFTVADEQYLVTFAVMLLVALVISTQTHRIRKQSDAARQAWERVEVEFLRNTLLSAVSHDLRTPLAAITGASSSLIETGDRLPPEARTELQEVIFSESERMERLINNLLDMTRLESGGLVMKKEWQPLQEVIGSALHHLDRRLKGRQVKTHLPGELPLMRIDAVAIEQVLVNVLDNAVEHTPASSPIDITAQVSEAAISIDIADRGPGLPPGTEQRLFQKFFRANPAERPSGLGLGLAICRGIIELHGGTISASNRLRGGAVFRVTLPRSGTPPTVGELE